jgi:hypothetical protein
MFQNMRAEDCAELAIRKGQVSNVGFQIWATLTRIGVKVYAEITAPMSLHSQNAATEARTPGAANHEQRLPRLGGCLLGIIIFSDLLVPPSEGIGTLVDN